MANPLFPFSDDDDALSQEVEQTAWMDDTDEMFDEDEERER